MRSELDIWSRIVGRPVSAVYLGVPIVYTESIMGVKELRDSFNLVADPDASASKAFLDYKTQGNVQYQLLTFTGSWSDGAGFKIMSDLVRPNGDVIIAARNTAKLLLKQRDLER